MLLIATQQDTSPEYITALIETLSTLSTYSTAIQRTPIIECLLRISIKGPDACFDTSVESFTRLSKIIFEERKGVIGTTNTGSFESLVHKSDRTSQALEASAKPERKRVEIDTVGLNMTGMQLNSSTLKNNQSKLAGMKYVGCSSKKSEVPITMNSMDLRNVKTTTALNPVKPKIDLKDFDPFS